MPSSWVFEEAKVKEKKLSFTTGREKAPTASHPDDRDSS
jgi:hypothetical protein